MNNTPKAAWIESSDRCTLYGEHHTRVQQHDILKLVHFTPKSKAHWKWILVYPVMTVLSGPQETIKGHTVCNESPVAVWSGFSGYPDFDTRDEAIAWCEANGVNLHSIEID